MRWDPTDPVQRRARYSLLSGMWAFFFAIFDFPEIALLLGALATYWSISALRAKPKEPSATGGTTGPAGPAATPGTPAVGQGPGTAPGTPYGPPRPRDPRQRARRRTTTCSAAAGSRRRPRSAVW